MKTITDLASRIADRIHGRGIEISVYMAAALVWSGICFVVLNILSVKTGGEGAIRDPQFVTTFFLSSLSVGLLFREWIRNSRGIDMIIAAAMITLANATTLTAVELLLDKSYVGGPLLVLPSAVGMIFAFEVFAPLLALAVALLGVASMVAMRQADRFALGWRVNA